MVGIIIPSDGAEALCALHRGDGGEAFMDGDLSDLRAEGAPVSAPRVLTHTEAEGGVNSDYFLDIELQEDMEVRKLRLICD